MSTQKFAAITAALSASLFLSASILNAQDAPLPAPPAVPAPPAQNGGAQDIMQRILEMRDANIKTELKVTDDEWAVIQPLLDKVEKAQFTFMSSGNFFGGMRRPGGQNGGNGQGGTSGPGGGPNGGAARQGSPETQALGDALTADATSTDDLKAKMAAVRAVRKKAVDDLAAARADLQKVLSVRQEAVLLNMGILD